MVQKYMVVRVQEPSLTIDKDRKKKFIVGQQISIKNTEDEALEVITEILEGDNNLRFSAPADHGYAIIPFYTKG